MSESLLEAGRLLVAGTLSPGSRLTYGSSLGCVSRWCAEHGLDLLGLSPVDVAALVVACRDAGVRPKSMLAALSFVYRNKPEPVEGFTGLARRVDRVWRSRFRDRLRPTRRAVVLPLRFWQAAHGAVHRGRRAGGVHPYDMERFFRDRFILSLGVSAGLRPGEFGLLSASGAHIAGDGHRLVLPLIAGSSGATTKTGRSEIVVPLGVAPFDVFPLVEDFEALRRFRLRRVGEEDTLVAAAWGYGLTGGLGGGAVGARLREAAHDAGLDGAMLLSGGSLRRSMVHIAISAGWSLERVAAVTGHATTVVLEQVYLDGYAGVWCRSSEGRQMLLDGVDGWADWPPNVAAARPGTDREPAAQPWWQGRDIDADRATAVSLVRGTPRVAARTSQEIARVGRLWEAFCARVGANPAQPSGPLIEAFCLDLTRSGSSRYRCVLHLTDHLAVLPSTDIADVTRIQQWAFAAVRLGEQAVKANRLRERRTGARREIVPVTDDAMNAIFSFPLVVRPEGVRLVGLVLKHAERVGSLTSASRGAFRFGEHANVRDDVAELSGPPAGASRVHSAGDMAVVCTVRRHGTDPLWCPYEAVRRLVDHYPDRSLRYDNAGGDWAAHCTSLIRWLQSRAAVAVLYATGLRPSDLDAIRWHDLRTGGDGTIMWRLPYSKGNRHGDRVQVLRLAPTDEPWCPIKALRRLALSVREARTAGWQGRTAEPDSDGTVRRVFAPHIGAEARRCLMVPAGVAIRPKDFRYRKAAQVWEETRDMQTVRAALFHRRAAASAVYVARGLPAATRAELDAMTGVFPQNSTVTPHE